MSTTDGAIDQKLFSDLEWIYHCLLPKTFLQMKRLQSTKFYLSLSAQIKQHNRYSSIINNFQGGPVKLDSMWQHRLTRPLHVQHTYYRIIFKQNPFNIISRGVQGCTSTDFRLK